jgi:hypothetical protein
MTVEADIYNTIKALVGNRVFPDVAPTSTAKPYITYSQVGGEALSYLERAVPDKQHGRFQVNVWADTRASASAVMLQVESALVTTTAFQASAVSAPSSDYDNDMLTYGSMQDFSIWSTR